MRAQHSRPHPLAWAVAAFLMPLALRPAPAQPTDPAWSAPTTLPTLEVSDTAARGGGFVAPDASTGTKTSTPIIETPQSVSVVPRAAIDLRQAQSLGEALRYNAGVRPESFGTDVRADWLIIRGFDAQDTGIFLNGLRYNGINAANVYETWGLDRFEIIRGPASVLYGAVAPGGIVNMVSRRPTTVPGGEVRLTAGSYGLTQAAVTSHGPIDRDGVWSYSLSALGRLSQTQVDQINNDRAFVAPALTWRPDADTRVTLLSHYQRDGTKGSEFLPYRGTVVPTAFGAIPTSRYTGEPKFGLFDREQFGIGYDAERRLDEVFTVRQNLRYQQTTVDWKQVYGNGLRADDRSINRLDFNDDRTLGSLQVDTAGQARFATGPLRHTVLFGVDYQRVRLGQIQSSRPGTPLDLFQPRYTDVLGAFPLPYLNSRQTLDQVGVYLQDQIRLGERLVLTAGARGDFTDQETRNRNTGVTTSQEDRQPTWRVGLVYLAPHGLAPYASYSTSFQPTIGTDAAGSPFVPRTADQYEVGLRWQPPGYQSFVQAAAFQITQQNTLTVNATNPQFQVQTGEVRVRGAELEAVANLPGRGLNLIASWTYLDPEITSSNRVGEEGTRPAGVPKTSASVYLDKQFDEGDGVLAGLGLGGGVRYVGNTATQNGPHQVVPSATLVDAALRYDLGRLGPDFRGAKLAVNVSNLFDKRYVSRCSSDNACFYGSRRLVLGSLIYSW